MRRIWLSALALGLAACSQTPQEKQAEQLRDTADAQGDAIEAAAENQSARMEAEAEGLRNQAGQGGGFEAQRLKVRADALDREAELIEDQAEAQAKAIRDQGRAKASALLAN